jgi:hypothetical protein
MPLASSKIQATDSQLIFPNRPCRRGVSQFHAESPGTPPIATFSLGEFAGVSVGQDEAGSAYLKYSFDGGTVCDGEGTGRSSEVVYR